MGESSLTGEFYFAGSSLEVDSPDPDTAVATGSFRVQSQPAGADIYIDGYFEGTAPVELKNLQPGGIEVRAEKTGYRDAKKKCSHPLWPSE